MNVAIELHDSTVTALTIEPPLVRLMLNTYVHKSPGRPGVDAGTGWLQEAVLEIEGGVMQGEFDHLPWDLDDGWCQIGDARFDNHVPVPLSRGQFQIHVVEAFSQKTVTIAGANARLELVGEPEFVENYPRDPWTK